MIDDYSKFNAIHHTALDVYPELPEWASEIPDSVPSKATGINSELDSITFTWCGPCGGWIPKPASETYYAQPTPKGTIPPRPKGTAYYCPRCGTEVAFKED